jgi:hypothetical protein
MSTYTESMTLEQRLARIEAYIDVQNLMSKYAFYHTANLQQECMDLFALDTADTWAEMTWGRYCGREGIEKLYPLFHGWIDGDKKGRMHMHTPAQPYIEVAGDCKTARGIWVAPGHETTPFMRGGIEAMWCWMKYDCDFIVENGEWKFWHMRTPGIFMTPYDKPWTEPPGPPPPGVDFSQGPMMPAEYYPDEPPIGRNWEYATDRIYPENDPEVPPRYHTWTEREWANRDNSQSRPVTPLAPGKCDG